MKKQFEKFSYFLKSNRILAFVVAFILLMLLTCLSFLLTFKGKIYPGVLIEGEKMGGYSYEDFSLYIKNKAEGFYFSSIRLTDEQNEWVIRPEDINLKYDINATYNNAYQVGRNVSSAGLTNLFSITVLKKDLPILYNYDKEALTASVSAIKAVVDTPTLPPSISLLDYPNTDGSRVEIDEGENGKQLDEENLQKQLDLQIRKFSHDPINLVFKTEDLMLNSIDVDLTRIRAERIIDKNILISYAEDGTYSDISWNLVGEDLLGFLTFDGDFNREKVASYSANIAQSLDREPVNATFIYIDGRVQEFTPAKEGLKLDIQKTSENLLKAMSDLELSDQNEIEIELTVKKTNPEITIADVNNLGIVELLGRGTSTFHGSIANREHNINLASKRISGIVIPPGEIFSFNKAVGEVSGATGYKESYIIKEGRTILDDGGGVCQVSTTLFRAILDSGLPVVERQAHAYRVYYYEQDRKPGYDATVFAPSVDLKFKNDTPAHLLLQASADLSKNILVIEIYGTADGRVSEVSNHKIWDVTPPPPDLYQDDPTLPIGVVKQVDWKAWGSKVKFDYKVKRNQEIILEKTFYSNFKPWQSVFLRGTGG